MLDDRLLVRTWLQRLVPGPVRLCADRIQSHEHTDPLDNGRLTEPRHTLHCRSPCCIDGLGLLLLSGVGPGLGLFDARYQLWLLHADRIWEPLRPLCQQVRLASLALLNGLCN